MFSQQYHNIRSFSNYHRTFVRKAIDPVGNVCEDDPMCISASRPLLKNLRTSAIDPKTPQSARTRKGVNGDTLKLVFSDEFDDDGRTFYDGDDPFFQGVDIWYGVTQDLEVCYNRSIRLPYMTDCSSGMTRMLSRPRMECLRSDSMLSKVTT